MSNSLIEVTNEFIKTNYGNFIQYFEDALYSKYETSFTSLIEQFYISFSIMKDMVVELLSLKNLISNESLSAIEQLSIDNILNIIQIVFEEFPKQINFSYSESFIETINARIEVISANIHQLSHYTSDKPEINKSLNIKIKNLENLYKSLKAQIKKTTNKIELASPLLNHIFKNVSSFKYIFDTISEALTKLQSIKPTTPREDLIKSFSLVLENIPNITNHLNLISNICHISSIAQHNLEIIMEQPKKIFQIIKSKPKKIFGDELKQEDLLKIQKYVNFCSKPNELIINSFLQIGVSEFIYVIELLQKQKYLISELKTNPFIEMNILPFENFNSSLFQEYFQIWKRAQDELNPLLSLTFFLKEDNVSKKLDTSDVQVDQVLKEFSTKIHNFDNYKVNRKYLKGIVKRVFECAKVIGIKELGKPIIIESELIKQQK